MIRRPPRSTQSRSSAASDVYKRQRLTDIVYAFPDLLLIILLSTVLRDNPLRDVGGGLLIIFFAIGVANWVGIARLTRGQLLSLKEREFVEAARALGAGNGHIIVRHLLPNALGPIIVQVTFCLLY